MRYSCRFDDGEHIRSFNQLKDADTDRLVSGHRVPNQQ